MYQNECIIDQPQSTPRRDEFYSRNEVETSGKKKAAIQNGKKKKKSLLRRDSAILELLQLSFGFLISNSKVVIYYYALCDVWYACRAVGNIHTYTNKERNKG